MTKISALNPDTAPSLDDFMVTVDNGSGQTKKVTLQNLLSLIFGSNAVGVWQNFTSTITPQTGAFTTVTGTGRYVQIGKTVIGQMLITMTNIGSGTGQLSCTLPVATQTTGIMLGSGRENNSNGKMLELKGAGGTGAAIFYYDNTVPMANGLSLLLQFSYEAA